MKVIKKFDVVMMKIIIDCKKNMKKIWFFLFYSSIYSYGPIYRLTPIFVFLMGFKFWVFSWSDLSFDLSDRLCRVQQICCYCCLCGLLVAGWSSIEVFWYVTHTILWFPFVGYSRVHDLELFGAWMLPCWRWDSFAVIQRIGFLWAHMLLLVLITHSTPFFFYNLISHV